MHRAALALLLPAVAAAAPSPHDIASYPLPWRTEEMGRVRVRESRFAASGGRSLLLDLYLPPAASAPVPAVVLVNGVGDAPPRELRRMAGAASWARLLASQGLAAAVPEAGTEDPPADMRAAMAHLAAAGPALGLDPARLALLASSADAGGALALLADAPRGVRAAALLYGAGDASRAPGGVPVLAVRAGRDGQDWTRAVDATLAEAEARGLPWTVIRAPDLGHAFDLLDDREESWRAVRAVVGWLRERLGVAEPPLAGERPPPPAPAPDRVARAALDAWRARDWPAAEASYGRWLEGHPGDGVASYRRGVALHHLGRHAAAATAIGRAVALGESAPAVHYNLACARARAGQAEAALDALEAALREGFTDAAALEGDPDLAPVRGRERFRKLRETLRRGGR
jgi:tetratricopeptide (TPR) repeat protein